MIILLPLSYLESFSKIFLFKKL